MNLTRTTPKKQDKFSPSGEIFSADFSKKDCWKKLNWKIPDPMQQVARPDEHLVHTLINSTISHRVSTDCASAMTGSSAELRRVCPRS
jgi:hypothetical protein